MAAFETPWTAMSNDGPASSSPSADPNPPTIAAFSPPSSSAASHSAHQVHKKSPLLAATPPQVTRALSHAFPWVQAVNWGMGLLTWTSNDPWESFLMVAVFWLIALYGDFLLRWGGNVFAVVLVIAGMYLHRYRKEPTTTTLDSILEGLNTLTIRINIFFSPLATLLTYLSSPSPTSATAVTTKPALTNLFIRILFVTPIWLFLAISPFHIITPRRIVVFTGTLILSWHSRPAKVTRAILWRSQTLRRATEMITGLSLQPAPSPPPLPPRSGRNASIASLDGKEKEKSSPHIANTEGASPGVKFTFTVYENQRRWLGVGWTSSLFAYERAPWTDEHLQPCEPAEEFKLPVTPPGAGVKWRWVPGEDWEVEGAEKEHKSHAKKHDVHAAGEDGMGWWYYDNKWRDGKAVDGWGKYTRRRKWGRRAELVEDEAAGEVAELEGVVERDSEGEDAAGPGPEVRVVDEEGREVVDSPEGEVLPERTPPPLPKR